MKKEQIPLLASLGVLLSGLVVLVGLVTNPDPQLLQKFAAEEIRPRLTGELPRYVPGEVIVKRKDQAAAIEEVPVGAEEAQAQILSGQENVEYVEPNYLFYPAVIPQNPGGANDPYFNQQENLKQVKAPEAWELVRRGGVQQAARVAVIDTGVDAAHLDLGSAQVSGDDNSATGSYHGTEVSGLVAAQTNNSLGISSLPAGLSTIESINVCEDVGGQVGCPADKIARGIRQASTPIINISLGGSADSQTVRQAILEAFQKGKLIIAAAGNGGTTDYVYPAAYPQVMAVAATASDGSSRATSSNFGSWVDVAAPGENILTTCQGDYCSVGGTSMAAAQVSGLAALLWEQTGAVQAQALNAARVRSIIQNSADPVNYVYFGRVNAEKALAEVVTLPTPTPTVTPWAGTSPAPTEEPTATPAVENFPPQADQPINDPTVTSGPVYNPPTGDCAELKDSGVSVLTDPHCAFLELQNLVVVFLNIAIPFAAVAALALLLWGGFMFITAGANPEKSEQARGTITWSIIGLVVAVSAWLIMKLVVGAFGNIPELSLVPTAFAQLGSNSQYELTLTADKESAQANGEEKIILTAQLKSLATPTPEVFEPLADGIDSIEGQKASFQISGEGVNLKQLDAVTNASGIARAQVSATQPGERTVTVTIGQLQNTRRVRFTVVKTVRGVSLEQSTLGVSPGEVRICGKNPIINQNQPCANLSEPTQVRITVNLVDEAGNPVTNVIPEVRVSGSQNSLSSIQEIDDRPGSYRVFLSSNYAETKTISAYIRNIALKDSATVDFVSAIGGARGAAVDQTLDLTDKSNQPFKMFAHKQVFKVKVDNPETVDHVKVEFNCKFNGRSLSHGMFNVYGPPNKDGLLTKSVDWMAMGGPADPQSDTPENGDCELVTTVYRVSASEKEPPIPQPPEKTPVEPIDPYGVVTNAKTGKVVTGAIVTLYEKQEDGSFALWPGAENNNQSNPQQTDTFGQYSFLVSPGEYYVTVEKTNYEAFRSETLEVVDEPIRHDVQLTPKTPIWFYLVAAGAGLIGLMVLVAVVKRVKKKRAMESLVER